MAEVKKDAPPQTEKPEAKAVAGKKKGAKVTAEGEDAQESKKARALSKKNR